MEIIDYYTDKSIEKINSDREIKEFKDSLETKITKASNINFGSSLKYKLLHPIKIVKAKITLKKLKKVETNFNKLINADVLQFVDEESGELETDLENSCNNSKPKVIKKYIKSYEKIVK